MVEKCYLEVGSITLNGFRWEGFLLEAMTLILAVVDDKDVVVAADGRMTREDETVLAEQVLKTVRLNDRLCVAFSGKTEYIRKVLSRLGVSPIPSDHRRLMEAWEDSGQELRIGYQKAQHAITKEVQKIVSEVGIERAKKMSVNALLASRVKGKPVLCFWGPDNKWSPCEKKGPKFEMVWAGKVPQTAKAFSQFVALVKAGIERQDVRSGLVDAIRFAAEANDYKVINGNVSIRSLLTGFSLRWELDEESGNWRD